MIEQPFTTTEKVAGRELVSVVIPCYNTHQYLTQTIESVRHQTYAPIEIILVDDGSTDRETLSVLAGLSSDVRVIRQDNKGLPAARNTGIAAANGEFILPLDADDWLDETAVNEMHRAMLSADNVVAAYCDMQMHGNLTGVLKKNYNFFEQLFFNQLPYCLLFRRRDWVEVGGYDEAMRKGYEDWDFNIRLAQFGLIHRVERPLFNYRILSTGMLVSVSNRNHCDLWRNMRNKHRKLYSLVSLIGLWRKWGGKPSTYPLILYFPWLFASMILPLSWTNFMFRILRTKSQSHRIGLSSKR